MVPGLKESRLEVEGDGEQSDDDVRQRQVRNEVVGHRLKIRKIFSTVLSVFVRSFQIALYE